MIAIERFLRDSVEEARAGLEVVEKMQDQIPDFLFAQLLGAARQRLGDAAQANSEYLTERESYLGQIEDLREQMKPIRMEAFAKERVDHYQRMAYMLHDAVQEAVESLSASIDESTAVSVREDLESAMAARREMSRGQ